MKIKKEFLTGKGEYLSSRYRNLYGEGNYGEIVKDEQKSLLNKYIIVALLFFAAVAFSISDTIDGGPDIKTDKDGLLVSIERPKEGESASTINARVWAVSKSGQISKDKDIVIEPEGENIKSDDVGLLRRESESDKLERKISSTVRSLNENTEKKEIVLPTRLEDGTKLYWKEEKKNNYPFIFIGALLTFVVIYRSRYDKIKKKEKAARESVIREMPGFLNKLVLLLNAGIVLNSAFEKIMQDYERTRNKTECYFYSQMQDVYIKVKETNCPMQLELASFAKRSGVRELMRLSNIITDNINKGTDLTDKLRREGEALWFARKKQSEEKGRLAETKLTMPLVILLLVLVMITIAPAMMDM